jgi:uncharacterized membrane protein YhiD involved in acid resistance
MFNELQQLNLFSLSLLEIVVRFTTALVAGLMVMWFYRKSYKGAGYASGFISSLLLLTLITALVMMVIGNNLARAFGLVGAMSIIRFRTAVKDTIDIIFIFFALAVGMAAGVGYYKMALAGLIFIGFTTYIVSRMSIVNPNKEEYLLQFTYSPNGVAVPEYQAILDKFCKSHKIVNIKTTDPRTKNMDMAFYVRLKNRANSSEFIKSLRNTSGVNTINLFFDEDAV